MIVGNGLLASCFAEYQLVDDVCIFASGVSNSSEISIGKFQREIDLIDDTLSSLEDNVVFVYFSSCSIYDTTLKDSSYVKHKLAVENKLLSEKSNTLIFRLPQLAGNSRNKNTLLNYLSYHICNDREISILRNAKRNIIDVQDVLSISRKVINDVKNGESFCKVINIANPLHHSVIDIVLILEKILNKKSNTKLADGGSSYDIDISFVREKYHDSRLFMDTNYLEHVLSTYYHC